jgi:hypothetical protein
VPRVMGSIPPQRGLTVPHALRADNNSHSIGDRFAIAQDYFSLQAIARS